MHYNTILVLIPTKRRGRVSIIVLFKNIYILRYFTGDFSKATRSTYKSSSRDNLESLGLIIL